MTNGIAYANIHTEKNPNGEMKDKSQIQIQPIKFFKTVR